MKDKLVGLGGDSGSAQGSSVSVSSDGSLIAIGGNYDDSNSIGATWIFKWKAESGAYAPQGDKLVGTKYVGTSVYQGSSVSLSSDGMTVAVGAPGDNSGIGATWIFKWSAGSNAYTQQGAKLVASDSVGKARQGCSVSLSSDGNLLAIGGWGDNDGIGATWIFKWSAGSNAYTQQGAKLLATPPYVSAPNQGYSVSLSSDASTLAVGGPRDSNGIGATWIFKLIGTAYTQQSKLVGTKYAAGGGTWQGESVSLSSDGASVAIGGSLDSSGIGATWVFKWSTPLNAWVQVGEKLVGLSDVVGDKTKQGISVSLSSDGSTLAVGGTGANGNVGATWIFNFDGNVYKQQAKLVGTNYLDKSFQGTSVSLSPDSSVLVSGGDHDNSGSGATWIFKA